MQWQSVSYDFKIVQEIITRRVVVIFSDFCMRFLIWQIWFIEGKAGVITFYKSILSPVWRMLIVWSSL